MRALKGSPRPAVTAIFFINGAALSSLYAHLPALQADLRLTDAALGVSPAAHLAALGALLVAAYSAATWLLPAHLDAVPRGPVFLAPARALAALGLVAFCCLLAEGAVFDWSAVYLRRTLDAGEATAAAGLAAFSLTMGLGRLTGDRLADRLGPVALARGGAALAGTSFALALFAGTPAAAARLDGVSGGRGPPDPPTARSAGRGRPLLGPASCGS